MSRFYAQLRNQVYKNYVFSWQGVCTHQYTPPTHLVGLCLRHWLSVFVCIRTTPVTTVSTHCVRVQTVVRRFYPRKISTVTSWFVRVARSTVVSAVTVLYFMNRRCVTTYCHKRGRRGRGRGRGHVLPLQNSGKKNRAFSGKCHVEFENFVIFRTNIKNPCILIISGKYHAKLGHFVNFS